MDLEYTLREYVLQLKNTPRTLLGVAGVVQKIMKTLYDAHFPNAENRRPGRNPACPDSDILTIGWLLEYIGADSEHSGYRRLKVELQTLFPCLPERSRFNRRRRIETTLNQLTQQFSVGRVRARTHWGFSTRMSNKFGACLLGAFLNQCLGRPLMKLKDLVLA